MNNKKPYTEIIEEPDNYVSFRYVSQNNTAFIQGINSTRGNKTYPTIKINNCGDYKKGTLFISCVTKEKINGKYLIHPHKIVRKNSTKNRSGVPALDFKINNKNGIIIKFNDLRIQRTKFVDMKSVLELYEKLEYDPFRAGFNHKNSTESIDAAAVRFCFEVILKRGLDGTSIKLDPVVTHVIHHIRYRKSRTNIFRPNDLSINNSNQRNQSNRTTDDENLRKEISNVMKFIKDEIKNNYLTQPSYFNDDKSIQALVSSYVVPSSHRSDDSI